QVRRGRPVGDQLYPGRVRPRARRAAGRPGAAAVPPGPAAGRDHRGLGRGGGARGGGPRGGGRGGRRAGGPGGRPRRRRGTGGGGADGGGVGGRLPLAGAVSVRAAEVPGPWRALRLQIRVENRTDPGVVPRRRENALPSALVAAHAIITVGGGKFISMTDPPE